MNNEIDKLLIGNDEKITEIKNYIQRIAQSNQPVLITGETGVGKELFARYIHDKSEFKGRMVTVNVAGLDDHMFSDTLFGHSRGAFTGADRSRKGLVVQASGGTLFLDEIGDLSIQSQIKLLRLIESGEYHPLGVDEVSHSRARIVTATNENLWQLQKKGRFRMDLNFRLRSHHIHIPPLRERKSDIPPLIDYYLEKTARELNKNTPTPPKELYILLQSYSFPGNVRELRDLIYDAVSMHQSKKLSLDVFKEHIVSVRKDYLLEIEKDHKDQDLIIFPGELPTIQIATKILIDEAMDRSNSVISVAAQMLGISRQALSKRLKEEKRRHSIPY